MFGARMSPGAGMSGRRPQQHQGYRQAGIFRGVDRAKVDVEAMLTFLCRQRSMAAADCYAAKAIIDGLEAGARELTI